MADNSLDISLTRNYLRAVRGIRFNDDDKIVVNGDLGKLTGTVDQYKSQGRRIHFTILARANGVFVDWHGHGQDARIDTALDVQRLA